MNRFSWKDSARVNNAASNWSFMFHGKKKKEWKAVAIYGNNEYMKEAETTYIVVCNINE